MELNSNMPQGQEATSFASSNYQPQQSGIRALPSHDDDDSDTETFYENISTNTLVDENIEKIIEKKKDKKGFNTSSSASGSSSSSGRSDNEDEEDFVSGGEEFELGLSDKPMSAEPEIENLGASMGGAPAVPTYAEALRGSSQYWAPKAGVPIAKVSTDDENDVVDSDYEGDDVVIRSYDVQKAPKVMHSGDEDKTQSVRVHKKLAELLVESEEDEEGKPEGGIDEPKSEVVEEKKSEFDQVSSMSAEANGVKFTEERDSIVESIHVDVGEALRSGAVLVGGVDVSEDSEVKTEENAAAAEATSSAVRSEAALVGGRYESKEEPAKAAESASAEETDLATRTGATFVGDMGKSKDSEAKAVEDVAVTNLASPDTGFVEADGVKFTGNGDSVVESINVDVVQAVRSGAAVVGVVHESNDVEGKTSANAVIDEHASANSGAADVGGVVARSKELETTDDTSVAKESVSAHPEATEVDGAKLTSEGDAVVDAIQVDVVEAIRSGAAVVGDVQESKETGHTEAAVDRNRGLEQELEELIGSSMIAKDPVSSRPTMGYFTERDNGTINGAPSIDEASERDSLKTVTEKSLTGVPEISDLTEKEEKLNADTKSEADSGVPQNEPAMKTDVGTTDMQFVSETTMDDTLVAKESVSARPEATEVDGAKLTSQGDAVVDAIHVDVIEAIRSGTAVVGDVQESKETGHMEATVNRNIGLEKEPEELIGSNLIAKDPVSSRTTTENCAERENGTINEAPSVDEASKKESLETVTEKALSGVAEISGLIEKDEKLNADTQCKADSGALRNEPAMKADVSANDMHIESNGGEQNVQHELHVIDDARTNSPATGEEIKSGHKHASGVSDRGNNVVASDPPSQVPTEIVAQERALEADNEVKGSQKVEANIDDSGSDGETDGMVFGSSAAARQFMKELEQASASASHSVSESVHEHSERVDGQIVTDSDEEVDSDEEGDGKELFDSAALAALLKAATGAGSDAGDVTIRSRDGTRLFSVERPAGLGPSLRTVRPLSRPGNSSVSAPPSATPEENLSEEEKKKLEKIQQLRVKFLRLVQRLGHSAEDSIAAQVMYRLALAAGRTSIAAYSLDSAKQTATQLEDEGKDDLNFSLNILVLGKTGVGKSATINSIFGEEKVRIDAFEPATTSINEISGVVDGFKIKVFDTPGLKASGLEQGLNRKILASVKKVTKKCPPDIVLYVDRLDSQSRDLNDLPLLRSITSALGSSIWRNVIVTLTHAACAPPEGPSGSPLSYEVFVAQRSHIVQQSIGQAVGDLRLMNASLMNPVSLVENHLACRKNREGQKVLPNGQTWKPQLLMLSYSMKILSEASSLSKPQDPYDHRKLFGFRVRSPPLPYLLSSLLQPRAHPKLADQGGDNADSDIDLDDFSDTEAEEEDEYDQLPPFKPLRKAQIAKHSKEQRKAYSEEYDYRVKLLQKKQWREELKRMRETKKKGKSSVDDMPDDFDPENGAPAAVPVPLPDMTLPPSFDCDNPAYRYRFLEPTSQFLARPVLDTHGWDHDCGYDGVNVEQNVGIMGRFPAAVVVQVTKDKKEFNIHLDSSISAKHGENGSSVAGFDIQTIGKQLGYILRGETKFHNLKRNKTAAGVSVTFLGENVATGLKLEDQLAVGKRVVLVGSTGTVRSQKDAAYGANLEVRLKDVDYPINQDQSSFVLSLMKWRGDLALGANLQTQFSVGRNSKMAVRVALNNKQSGQITVRTSSSDHLSLALSGLIPIFVSIYRSIKPGVGETYSIY